MPACASSSISANSACGSTTTPLPMTQVMPAMQDAGRQQAQDELAAVGVDGVAGVVAALIAGDDRKVRRQQVDDLALAFVAPLRAEHCDVHNCSILPSSRSCCSTMILLDGDSLTLDAARRDRRRRRAGRRSRRDAARARRRGARGRRSRRRAATTPVYGINTGLRRAGRDGDPARRARRAAAEPAAQPRRRRRRAAAGARRARVDGAARQRAGQGLLRHPPRRRSSGCSTLLNRRVHPRRAEPRLGRRERRPRAARAPGAGAHRRRRRRRSATTRRCSPGATRSRAAGLAPVTLGAEGRAGAHQRHAAVDRGRGAGRRRRRAARARRRHRRRAVDRRAARLGASLRAAHPRRAAARRPARPRPPTSARCSPAARSTSRTSTAAACRTPTRCAARAQVHGAARDALTFARDAAHDRGQRRHRQPDGVRRRRTRSSPAATSTARRSRSPPTCWRSRSPSSRRSASGAPIGSSTRR